MAPRSLRILAFAWAFALAQGVFSGGGVEEQRRQEQTTGCSTQPNHTISDCNATDSAAAIVVRSVSEHIHTCSPLTCGGDQCPNPQKRSLGNYLLSKRGQPAEGDWPDLEDYDDDMESFIRSEIMESSPRSTGATIVELSTESETTTSKHITFEGNPGSIAVTGLWGCTSIIVISRRGAWASHIWQNAFENDESFHEMAIQKVHRGDGTDKHKFGIDQLKDKAGVGTRGLIFGDETNQGDDPKVKIIIVTPRPGAPLVQENKKGISQYTSDLFRENVHVNLDKPPIYTDRLEVIKRDLKETFDKDIPIIPITYAPRVETNEESGEMQDLKMFGETEKLEAKIEEVKKRLADPEVKSTRGKVLIQYQPDNGCHDAEWRIFVEGFGVKEKDEWDASTAQIFA